MDTLALALALMMDGRTIPTMPSIGQGITYTGAQRDSVTLVKPEIVASVETRAKIATKMPNIWGE
jgi:hypothetical protein